MPGNIIGGAPDKRTWVDTLSEQLKNYVEAKSNRDRNKVEMAINDMKLKQLTQELSAQSNMQDEWNKQAQRVQVNESAPTPNSGYLSPEMRGLTGTAQLSAPMRAAGGATNVNTYMPIEKQVTGADIQPNQEIFSVAPRPQVVQEETGRFKRETPSSNEWGMNLIRQKEDLYQKTGDSRYQLTPNEQKFKDKYYGIEEKGGKYGAGIETINPITGEKEKTLSPFLQKSKDIRTEKLIGTIEENVVKKDMIDQAKEALNNIDSGIYGKIKKGTLRNLAPNSPMLGDWQKIKMVLTDAQLLNTAKTKGAISDREMELFADAAANDDLISSPAIKVVFNKLIKVMESDENSQMKSYKKIYGEDPSQWEEINMLKNQENKSKQYVRKGTLPDGRRIGILPDGTKEIIDAE